MKLETVYVCPYCGHTVKDNLPDTCPICGAKKKCTNIFK